MIPGENGDKLFISKIGVLSKSLQFILSTAFQSCRDVKDKRAIVATRKDIFGVWTMDRTGKYERLSPSSKYSKISCYIEISWQKQDNAMGCDEMTDDSYLQQCDSLIRRFSFRYGRWQFVCSWIPKYKTLFNLNSSVLAFVTKIFVRRWRLTGQFPFLQLRVARTLTFGSKRIA